MHYKKIRDHEWAIRIARGEKIISTLSSFCRENKIEGGAFYGIGAVDEVELAHYSVDDKKYSRKKFHEPLELTNITGTIGVEKEVIVHAHVTLGRPDMSVIAGHLVEGRISGTLEVYLTDMPKLLKKYDPETGLTLFDLSS
ncbi:MAG: DNA-binding protein [Candidatus Roizmanbacteria bacterium]|nr:DNA-binding protein [Candidatus Roizmanbacteria bacterium]